MVLIIGILAAVAVPQYQVAVEKSKTAQGWAIVKSLTQAQESYKLANGSYTRNWDDLDIDIPYDSTSSACALNTTVSSSTRQIGDWVAVLDRQAPFFVPVIVVRRDGPFKCYALYLKKEKPYCAESTDVRDEHTKNFCKNLGGQLYTELGTWHIYPL